MSVAKFETYVIHPGQGDPVPRIGSGMRIVQAKIGRKWVRIKAPDGRVTKLYLRRWLFMVPHFRYQGEEMAVVFKALDRWKRLARQRSP